ncbi:cobaltochelatase subunit CobN [Olivibacter sitiensis]|uniref:cobaltochelatase subunit CobN n=1 Tax=Olivibacter sitiensis TaxID=376470 RepID=UPI00041FBB19|nr:cobaltochelatase subunit CobN [Olivibacter sitiensis]
MLPFIKKHFLWIVVALISAAVLFAGYRYYQKHISRTRIAFVNYSSFQLARIKQSAPGNMVTIVDLPIEKIAELRQYDAVFVFGRGLELSPAQFELLQHASFTDLPIFVESANNPNFDVTNLKGEDLDNVEAYFKHGGTGNYRNLLAYTRSKLDGKTWFTEKADKPIEIPKDVLFYLEGDRVFETLDAFSQYARQKGFHKMDRPKIALLTGVPGPFNSNREHIDSMITALQDRNWNIYPIASTTRRLQWLEEIDPDLIVLMPHGRMVTQDTEALAAWLKRKNIPVLSALSIFQNYDKWIEDPQGYNGSLLTMNIALPELDGVIAPYVVTAQFKDKNGFDIFKAIPERLSNFCGLAQGYLNLRQKSNKDKKIAIYYFKGPGMNSLNAADLEVAPSLFNVLRQLKSAGYTVDNLPSSAKELERQIHKNGNVLNPYAEGNIDKFIQEANPAQVSEKDFIQWAKDLSKEQHEALKSKYGAFPGAYLASAKDGKDYISVARIQFGNVVLLPQPLPGIGEDSFKLIHGANVAPPYPYVASYLWTRHAFQADAIIHFGTHGSLEFTPGKQVGLSGNDWSDALIGTSPNIYVYTMGNIGEAIIAKRRMYTTLVSHLTPSFKQGGTHDELALLEDNLHKWVGLDNGPLKEEYGKSISIKAKQLGLYPMLKATEKQHLNDDQLGRLARLVEELDNEKIISGLYTIGKGYTDEEVISTVRQMAIDPIAYSLAQIAILKGTEKATITDNQVLFTQKYRSRAQSIISEALSGKTPKVVSDQDRTRAETWKQQNAQPDDMAIIRGFIAMGGAKKTGRPAKAEAKIDETALTELVVKVKPFAHKVAFLNSLQSDKRMKEATSLLDPETLNRAKTIAKAIPKMKEAIDIAQDPDVNKLIRYMQKEEVRQKVFALLRDPKLEEQAKEEKEMLNKKIRAEASSPQKQYSLKAIGNSQWKELSLNELNTIASDLHLFEENRSIYPNLPPQAAIQQALSDINGQIASLQDQEKRFAEAVGRLATAVDNIQNYKSSLKQSTDSELGAIINALGGGFTSVSIGGDPILSPEALPTGKNMVGIDAEKTPSAEAWTVGKQLGQQLIDSHLKQHHTYPKKVSFTLWAGDFIKTEGAMLSEIFYLLGVEPVRDPLGRVQSLQLIPEEQLGRPRIDVVVQTSGQFRDLGASRISLINKAVALAANAPNGKRFDNFVANGRALSEKLLKEKGFSPKEARELSGLRVFGGVDGNYGTNIMGMVEAGDKWKERNEIAETYINNMGAAYGDTTHWAEFKEGLFEVALQQTEVIVQPRDNNTWGPLSLDHVYEFMGGLNLAVTKVTGKQPDSYFNDYRNTSNARIQDSKEAIWVEAQSTILNPKYIRDMTKGGASSAETFAETFRNMFGWGVMKEDAIDQQLWDEVHEIYVNDKLNLNTQTFFERENPYALQEITGVLMEASRKGIWKANKQQLAATARLHAELVAKHDAGCSEFVCGNSEIRKAIATNISPDARVGYEQKVRQALSAQNGNGRNGKNTVLKKQEEAQAGTKANQAGSPTAVNTLWKYGMALLIVLALLFLLMKRRSSLKGKS